MEEVGVRQLKNDLSRYLRRVREGATFVVTDRGEPIARIVPAGIPDDVARLIAEGRIAWSGGRVQPVEPVRIAPGPPLSDYVAEDRR
jgi:prevent-host-death family protein